MPHQHVLHIVFQHLGQLFHEIRLLCHDPPSVKEMCQELFHPRLQRLLSSEAIEVHAHEEVFVVEGSATLEDLEIGLGQGGHGNSEGTQSEEHEEQDENTLGEVHWSNFCWHGSHDPQRPIEAKDVLLFHRFLLKGPFSLIRPIPAAQRGPVWQRSKVRCAVRGQQVSHEALWPSDDPEETGAPMAHGHHKQKHFHEHDALNDGNGTNSDFHPLPNCS
mmetsp:Transcript_18737/g.41223  ORF Transcript_18737/g.41223 Transcript_18737/m.41223 type:complete len:218 (+) Transcript_18737:604-1257(+)